MKVNPRLVIWDLDGTLIDSFGIYIEILAEAAALSGKQIPDEQTIRSHFHGSLDDSIKNALQMVDGDDFATLLNDFLQVQERYYEEPESHLYADALELMSRLSKQGARQIIVTNRNHEGRGNASPRYLVEHSSMKNYVDFIVCGDDMPIRKPDADVIAKVPGLTEVKPEQILVVGDQHVDAALAHNLNAIAVIVNRSDEPIPHLEQVNDSHLINVVKSLDEVNN